jgi:hypothetical protein
MSAAAELEFASTLTEAASVADLAALRDLWVLELKSARFQTGMAGTFDDHAAALGRSAEAHRELDEIDDRLAAARLLAAALHTPQTGVPE